MSDSYALLMRQRCVNLSADGALTEETIVKLTDIKFAVLATPEHFDMQDWFSPGECGTAGCLAGYAVAFALAATLSDAASSRAATTPQLVAAEWLGITWVQSSRLFYLVGPYADHHWPIPFVEAYHDAATPKERAQVLADRIDHFAATQGKE